MFLLLGAGYDFFAHKDCQKKGKCQFMHFLSLGSLKWPMLGQAVL